MSISAQVLRKIIVIMAWSTARASWGAWSLLLAFLLAMKPGSSTRIDGRQQTDDCSGSSLQGNRRERLDCGIRNFSAPPTAGYGLAPPRHPIAVVLTIFRVITITERYSQACLAIILILRKPCACTSPYITATISTAPNSITSVSLSVAPFASEHGGLNDIGIAT